MPDQYYQRVMPTFSAETERELLAARVNALEEKLSKIEHERDKTMTWGIRTLIGMVGALLIWIANSLGFLGRHTS